MIKPLDDLCIEVVLLAKQSPLLHNFFFDFVCSGLIEKKYLPILFSKTILIDLQAEQINLLVAKVKFESELEMSLVLENLQEYYKRIKLSTLSLSAKTLPQITSHFSSEIKKGILFERFFKFTDRMPHVSRFDAITFASERLNQIEPLLDYPLDSSSKLLRVLYHHYWLFSQKKEAGNENHFCKTKAIKVNTEFQSEFDHKFVAVLSFNLRNKYEIFDLDNFIRFVSVKLKRLCLDRVQEVIFPETADSNFRVFYLELRHSLDHHFEIFSLRKIEGHLSEAALKSIKQLQLPLFKPRNEEEIMKDIVMLSKQLTHPTDLAQVIIHFDHHNLRQLVFRVILIKVKLPEALFLFDELQELKKITQVSIERMKTIGFIRKKYSKEACVLSFNVETKNYVREDHTIDFQKARLEILQNLMKIFGPVRDFEGGMIAKQAEAFEIFQKAVLKEQTAKIITLENFFYGVYPAEFRSIIPVEYLLDCFLVWKNQKKMITQEGVLIFFMTYDEENKASRDLEFFQERSFKLHEGFWMKFLHEGVFYLGAMIRDVDLIKEVFSFFGTFI